MRNIQANDMISQHIFDTIEEIAEWDVLQGSGHVEINAWALKQMALELRAQKDLINSLRK